MAALPYHSCSQTSRVSDAVTHLMQQHSSPAALHAGTGSAGSGGTLTQKRPRSTPWSQPLSCCSFQGRALASPCQPLLLNWWLMRRLVKLQTSLPVLVADSALYSGQEGMALDGISALLRSSTKTTDHNNLSRQMLCLVVQRCAAVAPAGNAPAESRLTTSTLLQAAAKSCSRSQFETLMINLVKLCTGAMGGLGPCCSSSTVQGQRDARPIIMSGERLLSTRQPLRKWSAEGG